MPTFNETVPKVEIKTKEQAEAVRKIILGTDLTAYDTETTGTDAHSAKPLVVSLSFPKVPWNPEWGDERAVGPQFKLQDGSRLVWVTSNSHVNDIIIPALEAPGVNVLAHNAKYDNHVIYRRWGVLPGRNGRIFDTMVMDFLYNENRPHGLKECCEDYGIMHGLVPFGSLFKNPTPTMLKLRPGLSACELALETQREQLLEYAANDPYATLMLFYHLKSLLEEEWWRDDSVEGGKVSNLWEYYLKYEEPYARAVWQMEANGVHVAPERLQKYRPGMLERMQELENHYAALTGRVVDLNSAADVSNLLYKEIGLPVLKKTKKGAPSSDKEALVLLEEEGYGEFVRPLLEFRKLSKLLGTYVDGLGKHIRSTGRVHGQFNTHVTVTGRLSSSEPNLQNIENKKEDDDFVSKYEIRAAFVAPKGKKLVVADYATLEVVITAVLTGDEGLIKALNEGLDLHAFTASGMFGIPYEDIIEAKKAEHPDKQQKILLTYRKNAKTLLFGILYGIGAAALASRLGVTVDEAEDLIDKFFKTYPKIKEAKDFYESFCVSNGFVLTGLCRRRRLPEIWSDRKGSRNRAVRQLFNAVIQGTAADLMRFYMPALVNHPRLNEIGAKLVLQVHDEVVVETPEEHADEVRRIVEEVLCGAMPFMKWAAPLRVEAKIADTWAEGK